MQLKQFNLILLILISVLIISCKQKNKTTSNLVPEVSTQKTQFSVHDISTTQIEEMLEKNNDTLYVVNFWATWCPPCRREIPHFVNAQEINKANKFKLIFISLDEYDTKPSVIDFINKAQMKNAYIYNSSNPSEITQIIPELKQIPVTFYFKKGKKESQIGSIEEKEFMLKIHQLLK